MTTITIISHTIRLKPFVGNDIPYDYKISQTKRRELIINHHIPDICYHD